MKSKKIFLSALALTVLTPVIMQPVQVDASVKSPFKDVSKNSPYFEIIHEMRDQNIISGYENGEFRPNEVISRKHAAALVSRSKKLPVTKSFVKFKDVSEKNAYFEDIKKLQQAGIFEPDSKGNVNPNQAITRAEMAKILTLAFDLKVKATYDFPDVPAGHVASNYIRAIYSNGVTTGDNGYFLPNESLTRAHYAVFMHRSMNLDKKHVAKPIEKPVNPVTPTPKPNPDTKTGLVTDKYDHFMDVPLPTGREYQEIVKTQQKQQAEIRVREVHNRTGAFAVMGYSAEENLDIYSKRFGLEKEEMIAIINRAVNTGDVHDGGHFSLYYDFNKGSAVISWINN